MDKGPIDPNPEKAHQITVKKLLDFFHLINVTLILGRDLHTDHLETIGEPPILNFITNALQYDSGEWFYLDPRCDRGHYWPLIVRSDGSLECNESSEALATFGVSYLQWPDGTSPAVAIRTWNNYKEDRVIEIPVVLPSFSESPTVEGADLISSYSHNGKGIYVLRATVKAGEERLIKIYVEPDTSPPRTKITPKVQHGETVLQYVLSDEGLGVLKYEFYRSKDDQTWSRFEPTYETGYPFYIIKEGEAPVYYKVVAEDAAGNKATFYGMVGAAETPALTAPGERAKVPLTLIVGIAVLVIVIIGVLILLKRK